MADLCAWNMGAGSLARVEECRSIYGLTVATQKQRDRPAKGMMPARVSEAFLAQPLRPGDGAMKAASPAGSSRG